MSISTFAVSSCLCVCIACVCVCVCEFAAIIVGVDDLWCVLWLPQGTYKTTEWPFIGFPLCLVDCFIHHSVFTPLPPLLPRLSLPFSPISRSLSISVRLHLSLIRSGSFSLIKTIIDQLSSVHQRCPIVFLLFAAGVRDPFCSACTGWGGTARLMHGGLSLDSDSFCVIQ